MMIKVLVVDDDSSDLSVIRSALDSSKLDYLVVNDSVDTLEAAKKYRPDIILLDLKMPGMNGHEVLKAIRSDPKTCNIEVVQITASDNVDDLLLSVRLHITDYIIKPINIKTLIKKLTLLSVAKTLRSATSEFKVSAQQRIDKLEARC